MVVYSMKYLAIDTNLLANLVSELRELELLRERVKEAELLLCTPRRTAVQRRGSARSRTKPRHRASVNNYRLRCSRSW